MSKTLKEMHDEAYKSIDKFDNYNYNDNTSTTDFDDNFNYGDEVSVFWRPVAKPTKEVSEFDKQISKLKSMKDFNNGR